MTCPQPTNRLVRFGVFELDLQTGELRRKGARLALQQQPFQVLTMLVSRPGELVTRDELRAALWKDTVFVDFDHGLNKAVSKIRLALDDVARRPRFVETLERRGYRFIAPVQHGVPSTQSSPHVPLVRLVLEDRSIPLGAGVHEIGRDACAAIRLMSSFVSRHHARLEVDRRRASLEDLGSHNGTFLNGERISGARLLRQGDEIRIGPCRLFLHINSVETETVTREE